MDLRTDKVTETPFIAWAFPILLSVLYALQHLIENGEPIHPSSQYYVDLFFTENSWSLLPLGMVKTGVEPQWYNLHLHMHYYSNHGD